MSTKKKKFNSFYGCSDYETVNYPPVMVLEEDGVFGTLVPEKPIIGDYRDYSINNLIQAGIPLQKVPQMDASLEDVDNAVNILNNINKE